MDRYVYIKTGRESHCTVIFSRGLVSNARDHTWNSLFRGFFGGTIRKIGTDRLQGGSRQVALGENMKFRGHDDESHYGPVCDDAGVR